jgi:cell division protein FtsI (penicillin-binding protein 3)
MAWLQLVQAPALEEQARRFQTQRTQPLGQRRPIVDRTGRLVAIDEKRFRLWAHPRYFNLPGDDPNLVRPPEDVVDVLAPHLAIPASDLRKALGTRSSGIKLGEQIDPETAERIRALGISGLDLEAYPQRIYPQASLFANVVGS